MSHSNIVLSQLLKFVPRHEFESLAKEHHSGRAFRSASRWFQFVCLATAQLSGRSSLLYIVENISAQAHRLYHLGSTKLSRSNLSRIGYRDAQTGKHYVFLTNQLTLSVTTIAAIYKERWQIELFFKWINKT